MKIVTVDTVTQLVFLPNLFPINCYLVEDADGLTLIDAGMAFCHSGIIKAAAQLGKPVTRIILTHAHQDHVGALDALKQTLPDATVYISRRDALLLRGDRSLLPGEPDTPVRGGVPDKVKTKADILIDDGDHVGSLLAISAPGHTPGSMAFLDTRNRYMIAGDAFQTRGGLAVSGIINPWFPFPALATWCKQEALDTARKLAGFQPALLAVGHGEMLSNPVAAMNKAIARAAANPAFSQLLKKKERLS